MQIPLLSLNAHTHALQLGLNNFLMLEVRSADGEFSLCQQHVLFLNMSKTLVIVTNKRAY